MLTDLPLFAVSEKPSVHTLIPPKPWHAPPPAPSKRGAVATSAEAGRRFTHRAVILRAGVLLALRKHPEGLTADEIATVLGESVLACRPRVSELRKAGKIVATDQRRRNLSGMMACVWQVSR